MELVILWQIILRRKWTILISGLATIAAAVALSLSLTPVYETVARVKVKRAQESSVLISSVPTGFGALDFIAPTAAVTQAEVIKSAAVVEPVIRKLNLIKRWSFIDTVVSLIPRLEPEEKTYVRVDDYVDTSPVYWFLQRRALFVEAIEDSDVVEIYVYSDILEEARDVANELVRSYIRFNEALKATEGGAGTNTVKGQLNLVRQQLEKATHDLREFQEKEASLNFDDQSKAIAAEMARLENELFEVRRRIKTIEASLKATKEELSRQPEYKVSSKDIQLNPLVDGLRAELSNLKAKLAALEVELTPNNVEIQSLKSQIRALEATLADEPSQRLEQEESTLNQYRDELLKRYGDKFIEHRELVARERLLTQDISAYKATLRSLAAKKSKLNELELAAELAKNNYTKLSDDLRAANVATASEVANVMVITPAPLPDKNNPYYPDFGLFLAIAALSAPFVGLGIALLVDYVDDSFKTREGVEQALGLPILASFPSMDKRSVASIGTTAFPTPATKPLLDLRFHVLGMLSQDPEMQLFSMVSVRRGEGKTTLLRGLGYVLAQAGKKVLLVDLNFGSPSLHKAFRISPSEGISSLLSESGSPEAGLYVTEIPNLTLLPCEKKNPQLADLLDSQRFIGLLKFLKKTFDIILVDTPALSSNPEGFLVSSHKAGVIFVTVPLKTPKPSAKEAKDRLESMGARIVGVVLNKT
jgi:capsular exopolysaccharide synthesis family protein